MALQMRPTGRLNQPVAVRGLIPKKNFQDIFQVNRRVKNSVEQFKKMKYSKLYEDIKKPMKSI